MAKKRPRRMSLLRHRNYAPIREFKGVAFDMGSLRSTGAHSIGIGRKRCEGGSTNTLCLRFYVAKKRPLGQLSSEEKLPGKYKFFSRKLGGNVTITTDVIETPPAQFEQGVDPEERIRPVPGGVSAGIPTTSGTLGGWVWDKTDDSIVMLSNQHVLKDVPGVAIVQPSVRDGGSQTADRIGLTKRGIVRSQTQSNTVDCAIGDPDSRDVLEPSVLEICPAVFEIAVPELDLAVEKFGQTSRHTFGEITDPDWAGNVSGRSFEDCVRISPMAPSADWSQGGDSGSIIFGQATIGADSDIKPAVALHFAGAGVHGYGCKIQNVFASLNLTTLSVGAFDAFVDGMFEAETEGAVSEETESRLRAVSSSAAHPLIQPAPRPFVRSEREIWSSRSFHAGISNDLRQRLVTTTRGRRVTGFVDRNKAELLRLVMGHGDVRRATLAAMRPLVAGAVTTTDVLERVLTSTDIVALKRLARELERLSSDRLRKSLKTLRSLDSKAEGRSIADILEIET